MAFFGNRVEGPHQLAAGRIESLDEAADAVFTAVGPDQHLAVHHCGRHGFAITFFRVRDLGFPQQLAGLGVERHQLGIQRAHEQLAALDRHAPVVGAAAEGGDRTHLVLVVPELAAGDGVERVHMVERGGHVHHAIDHDRRRLHRLAHLGLEHEGGLELLHVAGVDLRAWVKTLLLVTAVGVQPVDALTVRVVQVRLRDVGSLGDLGDLSVHLPLDFLGLGACREGAGGK